MTVTHRSPLPVPLPEGRPLRVLSLGAGVQSSTLLLMAIHGEVQDVDAAVFADTQREPQSVYDWLAYLEGLAAVAGLPTFRVTWGDLGEAVLDETNQLGGIPVFLRTERPHQVAVEWEACPSCDGSGAFDVDTLDPTCARCDGSGRIAVRFEERGVEVSQGLAGRHCTDRFKMRPVEKLERQLARLPKGYRHPNGAPPRVERLLGISQDEVHRMKVNRIRWIRNVYPLIDARVNRNDCIRWMEQHGYPRPPRSACYFCPYHNDHEWRRLRDEEPEAWKQAVDFDNEMRARPGRLIGTPFLHRQMVPLDQADLTTEEDRGQGVLFGNECEGVCGI